MKKTLLSIVLLIHFCLIAGTCFANQPLPKNKEEARQCVDFSTRYINASCPMQVDDATTLQKVSFDGKSFIYDYVLDEAKVSISKIEANKSELYETFMNGWRTHPDMKTIRVALTMLNANVIYRYTGNISKKSSRITLYFNTTLETYKKNNISFQYPSNYFISAEDFRDDQYGIQCSMKQDKGNFTTIHYSYEREWESLSYEEKWVTLQYMLNMGLSMLPERIPFYTEIEHSEQKIQNTGNIMSATSDFTAISTLDKSSISGVMTCSYNNGYILLTMVVAKTAAHLKEQKNIVNSIKFIK